MPQPGQEKGLSLKSLAGSGFLSTAILLRWTDELWVEKVLFLDHLKSLDPKELIKA